MGAVDAGTLLLQGHPPVGARSFYNVYVLLRKLPALAVVLCLLASQALAGVGMSRCACCTARPCCPSMNPGTKTAGGATCPMHPADLRGASCSVRPAGEGLAIVHVHPELQPRPAVVPLADAPLLPQPRCAPPGGALPESPLLRHAPRAPPPRFLQVV